MNQLPNYLTILLDKEIGGGEKKQKKTTKTFKFLGINKTKRTNKRPS